MMATRQADKIEDAARGLQRAESLLHSLNVELNYVHTAGVEHRSETARKKRELKANISDARFDVRQSRILLTEAKEGK